MPKKHGSTHHIIPKSRGGPKESWNEKENCGEEHPAFHLLFINPLPCEAINLIVTRWTTKSGDLNINKLGKKTKSREKKIKAWEDTFGKGASPKKAIEIIRNDWTIKWCFQLKECSNFNNPKKKCPVLKLHERGELI